MFIAIKWKLNAIFEKLRLERNKFILKHFENKLHNEV